MELDYRNSIKVRVCVLFTSIVIYTALIWIAAGISFAQKSGLLAAAGISYTLGLRHAFDADHISAIDNVTRKLMSEGKYSTTIGFFFSIGHSTLVIAGCLALYFTEKAVNEIYPNLIATLNIISSLLASIFLLAIAVLNMQQLISIHRSLRQIFETKTYEEKNNYINSRGLVSVCAGGLFKLVDRSWKMMIIGFVFGLGFDTTASVTAVMMTANSSQDGIAIITFGEVLLLPLLFTCGMILADSIDSILMLGTYYWSDRKIVRRLFFNYVILVISITAAFFVGTIIGLSVIVESTKCESNWFCIAVSAVDNNFQYIGIALTCFIAWIWIGGYFYYINSFWYTLEDNVYPQHSFDNNSAIREDLIDVNSKRSNRCVSESPTTV